MSYETNSLFLLMKTISNKPPLSNKFVQYVCNGFSIFTFEETKGLILAVVDCIVKVHNVAEKVG